jgi:hypothetical protein
VTFRLDRTGVRPAGPADILFDAVSGLFEQLGAAVFLLTGGVNFIVPPAQIGGGGSLKL